MSFTNKTTTLNLPQWLGSDKPNFDIDINSAFDIIDHYATTVNEQISTLDASDETINQAIKTINSTITDVQTDLDTLKDLTNNQTSEISGLTSDVTKLKTDVSNLLTETSSLSTTITSMQSDIKANTANIDLLTTNFNTVQGAVDKLEAELTTVKNDVVAVQSTTTSNTNNISSLSTRLSADERRIDTLETSTDNLWNYTVDSAAINFSSKTLYSGTISGQVQLISDTDTITVDIDTCRKSILTLKFGDTNLLIPPTAFDNAQTTELYFPNSTGLAYNIYVKVVVSAANKITSFLIGAHSTSATTPVDLSEGIELRAGLMNVVLNRKDN